MRTDDTSAADRGSALTEGLGLVGWVARNVYQREIPDPSLMIGDDKEEAEYLAGAYNSIYEIIPVYEQSAIDAAVAAERERCAQIVEACRVPVGNSAAGEMAAEWTMDALREIRDAIRGA